MNLDNAMFAFAGAMVLLSAILTKYVDSNFFWFTIFIGANLLQSSFTGFCPAAKILGMFGFKSGCAFKGKE